MHGEPVHAPRRGYDGAPGLVMTAILHSGGSETGSEGAASEGGLACTV